MIRSFFLLMLAMTTAQAEVLRIGTAPNYPPYMSLDDNGQRVGLDASLLTEICIRGHYECEWSYMPLGELLPALTNNQIDVAAGGLGYSEARDRIIDFTCVYLITGDAVGTFYALNEVDLKSSEVAVTAQSLHHQAAQKASYTTRLFKDEQTAIAAVLAGEVEVFFGAAHILEDIPRAEENLIALGTQATASAGPAFAVAENNIRLLNALNQHLADISAEGRLAKMQQDWLDVNQGDIVAECLNNRLQS